MATRQPGGSTLFPNGQAREQYGNYWGVYATAATLPNLPGNVLPANDFTLEAGDTAYVTADASLHYCTSPGTAGGGDATWAIVVNGESIFAPRYIVGNVPAGDSAVAQAAPFRYIPDPGDGTGIQTALAEAAINTGDVWVRPGLYDYQLGAITGALTVPASVRLRGAGGSTRIQSRASGNQGAFSIAVGAEVADMTITAPAGSGAAGTQRGLVAVAGDLTFVRRISFQTSPAAGHGLRYCISVQSGGGATRRVRLEDIECNTTTAVGTNDPDGALEVVPGADACIISFSKFRSLGGDVAMLDLSANGNGINQLIGDQITLDDWSFAALRWHGVGQITNLNMTPSGPNAAAIAVGIATRPGVPSTVLRNVWLDPKGAIALGVTLTADVNGGVGLAPILDGLTYSGASSVTVLASVAAAAARSTSISRVAAIAGVVSQAIQIAANNPDATVDRCTIAMLGTSGNVGIGTSSTRTRVINNTVELLASGAGGIGSAVQFAAGATEGLAGNNNVVTANAADVGIDAVGNNNGNLVANVLDMATDANAIVNRPVTCNDAQNVIV